MVREGKSYSQRPVRTGKPGGLFSIVRNLRGRAMIASLIILAVVVAALYQAPSGRAATFSETWTSQADFETNDNTGEGATTRNNADTSTSAGSVILGEVGSDGDIDENFSDTTNIDTGASSASVSDGVLARTAASTSNLSTSIANAAKYPNSISWDAVASDTDGITYGFGSSSKGFTYDGSSGTITDISAATSTILAGSTPWSAIYASTPDKVYVVGGNRFGSYNIAANSGSNLSAAISSVVSIGDLAALAYDAANNDIYIGGANPSWDGPLFVKYDIDTGTATNLSSSISALWTQPIQSLVFDPDGSAVYLGAFSGNFASYTTSGTATDLTSEISSFWSTNLITSLAYDSGNDDVYLGGEGRRLASYDPTGGTATDLSAKLSAIGQEYDTLEGMVYGNGDLFFAVGYNNLTEYDIAGATATSRATGIPIPASTFISMSNLSYDGTNGLVIQTGGTGQAYEFTVSGASWDNLTYDIAPYVGTVASLVNNVIYDGNLYTGGDLGVFVKYNLSGDTATSLTEQVVNAWGINAYVYSIDVDPDNGVIYLAGSSGRAGSYDPGTDTFTNLTSTFSSVFSFTHINAIRYYNGALYAVGNSGKFGVYDISGNTLSDKTGKVSSFWGSNAIYALGIDSEHGKAYIGGNNGKFAQYDIAGDSVTDLTSTISPTLGTATVLEATYAASDDRVYIGSTFGHVVAFDDDTDTATNHTDAYTTAAGISSQSIFSLLFDGGTTVYFGNANGRLVGYDTAEETFSSYSSDLSGTFTGYSMQGITKSGTKLYLTGSNGKLVEFQPSSATQSAQSTTLDALATNIAYATLTATDTPGTGTITYALSNDGGSTFEPVSSGAEHAFTTNGTALKWKITLTGDASVDSLTISYNGYATSGTITNLKIDAGADAVWTQLDWTATTPTGTAVSLRTRGAADADGEAALSTANWSNTSYTTSGATIVDEHGSSQPTFRYVEIELTLSSSGANGGKTPSLHDITVTYAQNVAPQFNAAYGTNGVSVSQVTDANDANYGKVAIRYSVRDTDTTTGATTPGYITPSFAYRATSEDSWSSLTTNLTSGATDNKTVEESTYSIYTVYWDVATALGSTYVPGAQIRITANDNELVNNQTTVASAAFAIDTSDPTGVSVSPNSGAASTSSRIVTLTVAATDDSSVSMQFSNDGSTYGTTVSSDGTITNSGAYEAFASSKTWTLASGADGDRTVYVRIRDAAGNTATATATIYYDTTSPDASSSLLVRDISLDGDGLYRLSLSWSPIANPGREDFQDYVVQRSEDGGDTYTNVSTVSSRTNSYYVDTSVSQGTQYQYRVASRDTTGNVNLSQTLEVNPGTGPTISSVNAGSPGQTSATITWTTDIAGSSLVEYGPTTSYGNTAGDPDASSTAHSVTLTGLSTGTTYHYRVRSRDGNASEAVSADSTFTTGLDTTAPSLASVTVDSLTTTGAVVSWTTDESASSVVLYGTNSESLTATATTTGSNTGHSVNLENLDAGTLYYYRARSVDAAGNVGQSAIGTFTTSASTASGTPPVISAEGPVVRELKATEATIEWQTDKPSDSIVVFGPTTSYGFQQGDTDTQLRTHTVTLIGLEPETTYHYRVKSRDTNNNVGQSDDKTFTTTAMPAVSELVVSDIGLASAIVSWQTSTVTTSIVEIGTGTTYGRTITDESSSATTQHVVRIPDLSAGTTYHLRVSGVDENGDRITSDDYVFSTITLPTISALQVDAISESTAEIRWQTNVPTNAIVKFGTSDQLGNEQGTSDLLQDHAVTLTGLLPETTYRFRPSSRDKYGNEAIGGIASFTTTTDKNPPVIRDITSEASIVGLADTSKIQVIVSFTTDKPVNAIVEYGDGGPGSYSKNTADAGIFNQSHLIILNELLPATTYHFRIKATDSYGNTSQSDDYTVLTPRGEDSILQLVVSSLEEAFGWIPKIRTLILGGDGE